MLLWSGCLLTVHYYSQHGSPHGSSNTRYQYSAFQNMVDVLEMILVHLLINNSRTSVNVTY